MEDAKPLDAKDIVITVREGGWFLFIALALVPVVYWLAGGEVGLLLPWVGVPVGLCIAAAFFALSRKISVTKTEITFQSLWRITKLELRGNIDIQLPHYGKFLFFRQKESLIIRDQHGSNIAIRKTLPEYRRFRDHLLSLQEQGRISIRGGQLL